MRHFQSFAILVFLILTSGATVVNVEDLAQENLTRARKLYQIHEVGSAESALKQLIETYPKTEAAHEAALFLSEIKKPIEKPVDKLAEKPTEKPTVVVVVEKPVEAAPKINCNDNTVGVILPLSGNASTYGSRTLSAIQMAFGLENIKPILTDGIWVQKNEHITLVVADSKGESAAAKSLTTTLVNKHHVMAIIGDILTEPAAAVAKESQALGVTNLSLSRQSDVTKAGNFVFRLGMTTSKQVKAIAQEITAKSTMKKIAFLYPDNNYGKDMINKLKTELKSHDIKITQSLNYPPNETTFTSIADKLSKADFDVLFIPDFPKTVSYILPALISKGLLLSQNEKVIQSFKHRNITMNPIQLIGPSSWSGPLIGQRLGTQIDGALFVDGIDWTSPSNINFSTEFQSRTKSDATLLEAQAYEAALLLKSQLGSNNSCDAFRSKLQALDKWDPSRDSNAPVIWFEFRNSQIQARSNRP